MRYVLTMLVFVIIIALQLRLHHISSETPSLETDGYTVLRDAIKLDDVETFVNLEVRPLAFDNGIDTDDRATWRHCDSYGAASGALLRTPTTLGMGIRDRLRDALDDSYDVRDDGAYVIMRYPVKNARAPIVGYHIDSEMFAEPHNRLVAFVALSDADSKMGGGNTYVVPGSHKLTRRIFGETTETSGSSTSSPTYIAGVVLSHLGAWCNTKIPVLLNKGDVLLMDNALIHSSSSNGTDAVRLSARFLLDARCKT